jgi:hypothetical protein
MTADQESLFAFLTDPATHSDATPEIAGLQETYNIGEVDWAVIDASGTLEQTVKQCQTRTARCEAA